MKIQTHTLGAIQIHLLNLESMPSLTEWDLRSWFSAADFLIWKDLKNEKRRREFAGVRYVLFQLGHKDKLFYQKRSPRLSSGESISISHSGCWVVVALCRDFPIGVDIELVQEKISGIYDRFVHSEERQFFESKNIYSSTLLWSFKETVYKLAQIDDLSFSQQICVKSSGHENFKATILTSRGNFEVPLEHQRIGDYVLTFNVADVQKTK